MRYRILGGTALLGALALGLPAGQAATAGHVRTPGLRAAQGPVPHVGPITDISKACTGQNAEVEQAAGASGRDIYELWMGCHGSIGFSRSTDGGLHFSKPFALAASAGAWDPALAVAPNGTVYASFMNGTKVHTFPVVEASFNHGRTFAQVTNLVPRQKGNWGDRDFIAVAPDGTIYLTWDYGPSAKAITYICTHGGSCAFATGDLNVVVQKSADGGKTWGPIVPISPGFPASGADSAPLVVQPDGRIDLEYQGYRVTNPAKYTLAPAHSYATSSADGGATWSAPVRVGPARLTMSLAEWWIDGAIGMDTAGNLYATWDSQSPKGQRPRRDVGWLSYSTNHGRTWSRLIRVTPDQDNATHIVQVAGGRPGIAYVGWLADNSSSGYALRVRVFSISHGWLTGPIQVSRQFGSRTVWPGDTFGITALPAQPGAQRLALSWGSAVAAGPKPPSEIFSTIVSFHGGQG
jgi:hypothetical protein